MQSIQIGHRKVAQLGQGTWNMGDSPMKRAAEVAALRRGLELGLSVIDTAEMYGNGRSELLVGEAIGLTDVTSTLQSYCGVLCRSLHGKATAVSKGDSALPG